jgi:hypothetical protein
MKSSHPLTAAQPQLGRCTVLVAGMLAASALGCGDEERPPPLPFRQPIAGCEQFQYRVCDILTDSCQRELFGLAACLHGDSAVGEPPPVRLLDEASAIALVAESSTGAPMTDGLDVMGAMAAPERGFSAEVRGLELIGLLSPGLIEDESDVLEVTVSALIAYYLVPTREIVIIDRGEPVDDLAANSVLVHELIHALQDRRHDIASFDTGPELDSDGYLARASLIEGEASLYEYVMIFAYQGADVDTVNFPAFFADLSSFGLDLTADAGSPAVTARGIFPYTYGTRYAGQRWLAGGNGALDALYQSPPRTSWEVLGELGAEEQPVPTGAFATAPAALQGSTLVTEDVVGAWVTVAMLAGLAPDAGADELAELPELARKWRADRYWIYDAEADGSVSVLWAIDWADADAAARFAALASGLSGDGAALRIDTAGASTRITAVERPEDLQAWPARFSEPLP